MGCFVMGGELRLGYVCLSCGGVLDEGSVLEHLGSYRRPLSCPKRLIMARVLGGGAVGAGVVGFCSPHKQASPSAAVLFGVRV